MEKYSVQYYKGKDLRRLEEMLPMLNQNNLEDKWWQKKIQANGPQEAYEKFLIEVGTYPIKVIVDTGKFKAEVFDDHIESAKKRIKEEKAQAELTKETTMVVKSTEELLLDLIDCQKKQYEELKKLNFRLMMFWIFLVVLPLLGWLLTQ